MLLIAFQMTPGRRVIAFLVTPGRSACLQVAPGSHERKLTPGRRDKFRSTQGRNAVQRDDPGSQYDTAG